MPNNKQNFNSWLTHYFHDSLSSLDEDCKDLSLSIYDLFSRIEDNDLWTMLLSQEYSLYPNIKKRLPKLADRKRQSIYNAHTGWQLLNRARLSFEKIIKLNKKYGNKSNIADNQILDFGVGWGRIIRFFLKEVPAQQLNGCDTSPQIIKLFNELNIPVKVKKSEGLPTTLPFDDDSFDLVYSNSIFTHLSEESTDKCINAIHRALKPKGLFYLTTWSPNYVMNGHIMKSMNIKKVFRHRDERLDFLPDSGTHPFYGASFISFPYMKSNWTDRFDIVKVEMQALALDQIVILLRKK